MGKSKPKIEVTEYFMSEHFGICHAEPDALLSLTVKEKTAWTGQQTSLGAISINQPELFGGIKKEGGLQGTVHYLPGADDQVLPDALAQKLGRANGADCPGFRGLASLFFYGSGGRGFYWTANTPYLPGVWATIKRILKRSDGSTQWYPEKAAVPVGYIAAITLRWEMFGSGSGDSGVHPVTSISPGITQTYNFNPGDGQTHTIPITVTGNVELRTYPGSTPVSGTVVSGGTDGSGGYNIYKLQISNPPATYRFNNGTSSSAGLTPVNASFEIEVADGATLTYTADPVDGDMIGTYQSLELVAGGGADMNPAHIIHECLTDALWGMGTPVAALDDAAFRAAADALYQEGFGLSMLWTRQTSIQDFVQEILDHIQGVLYVDPATGLLTLSLIRGDYDADTLDVIDPDNADLSNFSRKLWGDIVNEIIVTWTNPVNEQEETITVQDDASIAIQGGIVSDSRNYYGVRYAQLAQDLAYRDLRSAGQPLASCQAEVDRSQWALRPASVVKLTWPEYGLVELVMRVQSIDYGKPGDPTIKLQLVEDVFGLDVGAYGIPPSTSWTDPSAPPAPIDSGNAEIFTLPYFFALGTTVAAFVESPEYPEVIAGVLATDDSDDTFAIELWDEVTLSGGSTEWQQISNLNVIGRAELVADLDAEALSSGIAFENFTGQTVPEISGFVIIGDEGEEGNEIALITDVASDYDLTRGCLDTIPRAWPAGTPVWFINDDTLFEDGLVRSAGELVDYKLRTRTSQGLLALADAPVESYTLTERPWLPNRPANVVAYGEAWSSEVAPIDARLRSDPWITVSWAIRNRLDEDTLILAWTDASATAEAGQTTTIDVCDVDGTVIATHDGLAGTSYDVPDASFGSESIVRLRVYSERSDADGDFVSLQFFEHWIRVANTALATEQGDALATEGNETLIIEGET